MSEIPKLRLNPVPNAGTSCQTGSVGWTVSEPNPFVNGQTLHTQYESLRALVLGGYDWFHQNATAPEAQWYGRLATGVLGSYLMGWNMMLVHEGAHALADNRSISEVFGYPATQFFAYHTVGFDEWHVWLAPFPTGGYQQTALYNSLLQKNGNVGIIQLLDNLQNVGPTSGWNMEEAALSRAIESSSTQGAQTHFLDSSAHVQQRFAQIIYILKHLNSGEEQPGTEPLMDGDPATYMAHLYLDGLSAPVDYLLYQVLLRDTLDIHLWTGLVSLYQYFAEGNPTDEAPSVKFDSWRLYAPVVSMYFMPSGFFYNVTPSLSESRSGITLVPSLGARINLAAYQTEHEAVEKLPPNSAWRAAFNPVYDQFHSNDYPDTIIRASIKVVADVGSDSRWYLPHRVSGEAAFSVNETDKRQLKPGFLAETSLDWHPLAWLDLATAKKLKLEVQFGYADGDIRKNLVEFEPPGFYYDVIAGYELTF